MNCHEFSQKKWWILSQPEGKSLNPTEAPQRSACGAAPRRGHGGRGGRGPGAAEAVSGGPLLCFDGENGQITHQNGMRSKNHGGLMGFLSKLIGLNGI